MVKLAISMPHLHLNVSTAHQRLFNVDFRLWYISTLIPNRLENTNSMKWREKGKSFSLVVLPSSLSPELWQAVMNYLIILAHLFISSRFCNSRIDPHTLCLQYFCSIHTKLLSRAHNASVCWLYACGSEAAAHASLTSEMSTVKVAEAKLTFTLCQN